MRAGNLSYEPKSEGTQPTPSKSVPMPMPTWSMPPIWTAWSMPPMDRMVDLGDDVGEGGGGQVCGGLLLELVDGGLFSQPELGVSDRPAWRAYRWGLVPVLSREIFKKALVIGVLRARTGLPRRVSKDSRLRGSWSRVPEPVRSQLRVRSL